MPSPRPIMPVFIRPFLIDLRIIAFLRDLVIIWRFCQNVKVLLSQMGCLKFLRRFWIVD